MELIETYSLISNRFLGLTHQLFDVLDAHLFMYFREDLVALLQSMHNRNFYEREFNGGDLHPARISRQNGTKSDYE